MIQPSLSFHYEIVDEIATGGNSTVLSIRDRDGELYACKIPEGDLDNLIYHEAGVMSKISK